MSKENLYLNAFKTKYDPYNYHHILLRIIILIISFPLLSFLHLHLDLLLLNLNELLIVQAILMIVAFTLEFRLVVVVKLAVAADFVLHFLVNSF